MVVYFGLLYGLDLEEKVQNDVRNIKRMLRI